MPYIVIEDFRGGLDRRKSILTAPPGTLWLGENAHLTRGGEVEKRKAFVAKYSLPAGTDGLHAVGSLLYVFGEGASPAGLPPGVQYMRLQPPDSATLTRVLSIDNFDGKIYAIAEFSDGDIYHFYDGARVTNWDNVAVSVASEFNVALALAAKIDKDPAVSAQANGAVITITATTPGTDFTVSAAAVNNGTDGTQTNTLATVTPNAVATAAVRATGSITVTGGTAGAGNALTALTVNGVDILGAQVAFWNSNADTAQLIADQINSFASTPEYTATAAGAVVTIQAAVGTGATPNGFVVARTVGGTMTATTANMAGGAAATAATAKVVTATIGGLFEAADLYSVTINGTVYAVSGAAAATGTVAKTLKNKLHSTVASLVEFSAVGDPKRFLEVKPSGTVTITGGTAGPGNQVTSITVNGVDVLGAAVLWATSHANTASLVAAQINTFTSTPNYTATASGAVVTIQAAAGVGEGANGYVVTPNVGGTVTASSTNMANGLLAVGAGFINMSSQSSGSEQLTALAVYQNNLAIFSRRNIQVWFIDEDPALNRQLQVMNNIGTFAPNSIAEIGESDIFFLSSSGVRSLRTRDAINLASVYDIGTPIDTFIVEQLLAVSEVLRSQAVGAIEPSEGRYWLSLGDKVFVFSYFPTSKISAWSTYNLGFSVEAMAIADDRIYVRSGNTIYLYGGDNSVTYDSCRVDVILPYLDAKQPATQKTFEAVDLSIEGVWSVSVGLDPEQPDTRAQVAVVGGPTFQLGRIGAVGQGTHFGARLVNEAPGPAKLANMIIHYSGGEAT